MKIFICLATLAAVAMAVPEKGFHNSVHLAPIHHSSPPHLGSPHHGALHHFGNEHHTPVYHSPAVHDQGYQPEIHHAPVHQSYQPHDEYHNDAPYGFEYAVQDPYYGGNFGHVEQRDGHVTKGSYFVDLPDGRRQTVTYTVDKHGYHPVVTYEGEAHYDDVHHNTGYHGTDIHHKPSPVYH